MLSQPSSTRIGRVSRRGRVGAGWTIGRSSVWTVCAVATLATEAPRTGTTREGMRIREEVRAEPEESAEEIPSFHRVHSS